jgi:hypothetical protein
LLVISRIPKTDVLKGTKGLSKSQLNFKPSGDKCSIKECIYHIAAVRKKFVGTDASYFESTRKSRKTAGNKMDR